MELIKWIQGIPRSDQRADCMNIQRTWNRITWEKEPLPFYVMGENPQTGDYNVWIPWRSKQDIAHFMEGTHEYLLHEHPFGDTLETYQVDYLAPICEIGSSLSSSALENEVSILRQTICNLIESTDLDRFLHIQREVWNHSFEKTPGFLGGWVCQSMTDPTRVLIITVFDSIESHQTYCEDILPPMWALARESVDLCHSFKSTFYILTDLYVSNE